MFSLVNSAAPSQGQKSKCGRSNYNNFSLMLLPLNCRKELIGGWLGHIRPCCTHNPSVHWQELADERSCHVHLRLDGSNINSEWEIQLGLFFESTPPCRIKEEILSCSVGVHPYKFTLWVPCRGQELMHGRLCHARLVLDGRIASNFVC